jgi:putative hydrolase of HD superfamily
LTLDELFEAARLKAVDRAGWVRVGVPSPESVAAHSWGIGWLVLALLPADLDRGKALAYAILHDLPEVRVGDLTPADGVGADDKARREHAAMAVLCRSRPDLLALFEDYERQADPEARFVKQLDRLDMAIQAVIYAGDADTREFVESAARVVDHPALMPLMAEIRGRFATP